LARPVSSRIISTIAGYYGGFTAVGTKLYFTALDAANGYELRWIDTSVGSPTVNTLDIQAGPNSSVAGQYGGFTAVGTKLYFTAGKFGFGDELFVLQDTTDTTPVRVFDLGDAPASYATLLANDGPRHRIGAGPRLGSQIDRDADGQPFPPGLGDDNNGSANDEDGVSFPAANLVAGLSATVQVTTTGGGLLDAWIDFDGSGTFEQSEKIASGLAVPNGPSSLTFATPVTAVGGITYARFRLSTAGSEFPTGEAADGEVEDYAVTFTAPPAGSASVIADPTTPGKFVLLVNGKSGNDYIYVYPYASGKTRVELNHAVIGTFNTSSFQRIAVFGLMGNDTIKVNPSIAKPAELHGNEGRDTLFGTNQNDTLFGEAGDDYLYGLNGNDTQSGGDGFDRIWGDGGNDTLFGGLDNDSLYGGAGNDTASGDEGDDTVFGDGGNDKLYGNAGNDSINGGSGNDFARGGIGNDRMNGGADSDVLLGEEDNDTLKGEAGRDILIGGFGSDILSGGEHEDILIHATTSFDANDAALAKIMAEWSSGRSYGARIANIRNGTGPILTGTGFTFTPGVNIIDDGASDTLTGNTSLDWFISGSGDTNTDRSGEQLN